MSSKGDNRIFIAKGERHTDYDEISIKDLVETYDYSYFSKYMEHWARDAVSSYIPTYEENLEEFVKEYLHIAHSDLIVDDID